MNSDSVMKISFGKTRIYLETNAESKVKKTLKEFSKISDKQKYLCIEEPYSSMLKFADFVVFVNEKFGNAENLNFKLQGAPYQVFYLLKRATWTRFASGIKITFSYPSAEKLNNPLNRYMNNFVLKMTEHLNMASNINQEQVTIELRLINGKDLSDVFHTQHELVELSNRVSKNTSGYEPIPLTLSIIVPTKNVSVKEISRSVDSYINQLKEGDEIIVVDDNDSPETRIRDLCDRYELAKYIIGPKEGVAAARNLGLKNSSKELISFIDSDDYVDEDFISSQRDFHNWNQQVAATGTWLKSFGSMNVVYPQWDNLRLYSLTHCLPPAGVLMWKRNVLVEELNGFNESFGIGFEDFDLVARASIAEKSIVVLEEVKYFYQRGHQSLTQNWSPLDEFILSQKVRMHARELNDVEFASFLEIYERFGPGMGRIPFDNFVRNVSWMRSERLFWYLLNRVRTNNNVRQSWLRTPKIIRIILNRWIWIISGLIDSLHQTRFGKLLDPMYEIIKK